MNIPESYQGSPALQFIQSRGWNWKVSTEPNIELEICPYCNKGEYGHFYMEIHGPLDEQNKRDGLNLCHKCGQGGSLYKLKQKLNIVIDGVQSRSDWADKKIDPLPDLEVAHQTLLEDIDAMDYLVNTRGFSREVITKQRLGLVSSHYFKECGNVKALVYPYLVGNNCIFVHYRTLPPSPKSFSSPRGWDVPLFNGQILKEGLKEVVFVEGEANVISAMDKGVVDICGVPGANVKKAEWIDTLDKLELERIYICYDKDKVGQKAAQTLASRIGIEKCWKIVLPDFDVVTEENETRQGKDLNEWFVNGGTIEAFEELKAQAELFNVDGVLPSGEALQELEDEILKRGMAPKYCSKWPSFNRFIGLDDGDILDIVAPAKIGKTTFALNLLEDLVDMYGEDGVFICLEMTTSKLARKWVSKMAQIKDNIPKTPEEAEELKTSFLAGISEVKERISNREGNIHFCYPRYQKIDDLYKLIIDIIRRYGVKFIVFDNIQLAADTTVGSKNRTQHISEISKMLQRIAKEYGVILIRIVQPGKIKEGKLTKSTDADGSSQISKDCDASIALDRNRVNEISAAEFNTMEYIENESTFGERLLVTIDLSRYSGGGYVVMRYDGAMSTISEYNESEIAKMQTAVKNVGHEARYKQIIGEDIQV